MILQGINEFIRHENAGNMFVWNVFIISLFFKIFYGIKKDLFKYFIEVLKKLKKDIEKFSKNQKKFR